MPNISVWIFDTKGDAQAQAQYQQNRGKQTIGPSQLGSVDVTDRSAGNSVDKFFRDFQGKWGIAVLD